MSRRRQMREGEQMVSRAASFVPSEFDEQCMRLAIAEAQKALGRTSPNPCVGAVIAANGKVLASHRHEKAGQPHAEINAMRMAEQRGVSLVGATVYVTLEPCAHTGRTGPCAEALVKAGVGRVVFGCVDDNPLVGGKGLAILRAASIQVDGPVLPKECRALVDDFFTSLKEARPYVIGKSAMSMDGNIATARGESKWITNEASRADGRSLRGTVQAILVGRGTVEADDPALTARIKGVPDPVRVIFDTQLKVSLSAKALGPGSIVVASTSASTTKANRIRKLGGEVWQMSKKTDIKKTLHRLYRERGMTRVLVEGGAVLLGAFAKAGLLDEWHVFLAPRMLGNGRRGVDLTVSTLAHAPAFEVAAISTIAPEDGGGALGDVKVVLKRLAKKS